MKYLIVGAGGTGGSIGAYMAREGMDVTIIARGEHLRAMREKGLKVIRPNDEFVAGPVKACEADEYADKPDVIFVCVKGYSIDDIIPFLTRVSDEHTIIIPILNIFSTGRYLADKIPGVLVTDGCIYVAAQIDHPGCIRMNGDILRVVFGVRDKEEYRSELKTVAADLKSCGIDGVLSDNITRDALVKFSYVSAAGACGLYYNVAAGDIKKPGECRDCFVKLIKEVEALGVAMGIEFEEDLADRNLKILNDLADDTTTSMQRDVYAHRKSEIDGLIYEVVRLGKQYGVSLPEYQKIADEMKARGLGQV